MHALPCPWALWSRKLSVLRWGLTLTSQIVEFSHARAPDCRVFSRSWARSSTGGLERSVEKTQRFDMGLNPHEPDRRVFSCSWPRSSRFLALMGQIVKFSRAPGSDHRVFSPSRARSSSFLVLQGQNIEFSHPSVPDHRVFSCTRSTRGSTRVQWAPPQPQ